MEQRYKSRNEIEELIKNNSIDRDGFSEYSKQQYEKVITRFYYAFIEHDDDCPDYMKPLNYLWLHVRKSLDLVYCDNRINGWEQSISAIKKYFAQKQNKKMFLLLSDGWVYKGFIDEILFVLRETGFNMDAFYIFSHEYDRLAVYSSDAGSIRIYE